MRYVIVRDDGAFVADMRKGGGGGSYTRALQFAKIYASRGEAEKNRCPGNETVHALEEFLQ